MSVETWPATLVPNDMRWGVETNTLSLTSPLAAGGSAYPLAGARWVCDMTFRNLTELQQRELVGLLDGLAGIVGRVAVPVWLHGVLRGGIDGTVLATGDEDGVLVSLTGITGTNPSLRPGDMIGIGGTLYRVLEAATHTAGAATAIVAPPLRSAFVARQLAWTDLTCTMRLAHDDASIGRFRPKPFGDFSVRFVEALPVLFGWVDDYLDLLTDNAGATLYSLR